LILTNDQIIVLVFDRLC